MDVHHEIINPKLKTSDEIRVEPPVPVEPIIKANNAEVKQEKSVKVDSGNTISKDAINKEDEELEKRPEIELLEKLKSHEKEEKKILAESKKILEELKGARQVQFEKNKRKLVNNLKNLNTNNMNTNKQEIKKNHIPLDEKKSKLVKEQVPLPLVLKEANRPNKTNIETKRDKRDLTSTMHSNTDENEENCNKNEKSDATRVKNVGNIDNTENISIPN